MQTMPLHRPHWLRTLTLLASTLPAHAGVHVVDQAAGPGSDFTAVQAAVDAALDGDTILVRDGTYMPFVIDGKALTVVADGPGVLVQTNASTPTILVRNLPDGGSLLVRGFRTNFGVSIVDCAGAVWFDDLQGTGATSFCSASTAGASVVRSAKATFTRCGLTGAADFGGFNPPSSGAGLRASFSNVQLYDCQLTGAKGVDTFWWTAWSGGAGLSVESSTVTVVGCAIAGGGGGLVSPGLGGSLCTAVHPPGGPGLEFADTAGIVQSAESTAVGGATSLEPLCPGQSGPQGPAITGSGTIVALPGYARHLSANSPVRGGETLAFDVQGQPGEVPLLLVSFEHEPLPLLAYSGVLLVGLPPADTFVLGALPASGQASLSFPVPNVGASVGALTAYAQAAFLDPSPRVWLGGGTTVTLLDAGL